MNIINKPPYVAITGVGKAHGEIEVNNEQMALIVRNAVYQKFERSKIDLESEWAKGKLPSLLTDADWILSRTGISRRYFTDRAPSDLAVEAVKQALAMSGLKAEAIDFIIFTTVNPDYPFSPPTASVLHGKLGLSIIEKVKEQLLIKNCITFDLSDACTSFGSGLAVGWSLIASGLAKRGIVIGADRMSTTVDKADRNFSILLGDAAGVFVLKA